MDDKLNEKNKIVFKKTSDPMISAGIIGLYKYCEKREKENNDFEFFIDNNQLTIQSKNLEQVMKEMYYEMGKDFYDTSTKKQIEKNEGFYYDEDKDDFVRFPKVKTNGMANLIHDAQPTPLGKTEYLNDKKNKLGEIIRDGLESNNSELYRRIKQFGEENHISLGKKIWINNKNTATPNLEKMKIEKGTQKCSICGDSFDRTYESKSFSPFIGGSSASRNYVSMTKGTEKICWKCFYLQRFSPSCSFFYNDYKNENLHIFLFNSNSLVGMKMINLNLLKDIFYTREQLIESNYSNNLNIYNFEQKEKKIYFNLFSELFLLLLYTIYKKVQRLKQEETDLDELFKIELEDVYNTEVFFFQTKKFASTMRPIKVDKFTEIYYIFYLFESIDKNNKINFYHLLLELLLAKDEKNPNLERAIIRNEWSEKVLKRKSTIKDLEKLAWKNFSNKDFRNDFNNILEWLVMYESLINYGGNKMMNDEMRDVAINLGKQIVIGMEGKVNKSRKDLKQERGKLISLRKTRTLNKFLEQIISMQIRYDLTINKEILDKIDEKIFDYFRQFTIISALNLFNLKISKKKQNGGKKMNKKVKSLTITYLSKVSFASLNGSDSDADNINTIKKITLENNEELPYVSSQAIRRALRDQLQNLGWPLSEITGDKDSKHPPKTQCDPANFIDDDLFGFMDAQKETNKRTSPIRVESLIALSKYQGDLDFGTNFMGMKKGINPNIYETEIHSGIYRGTILIELDRIGCEISFDKDKNELKVVDFIDNKEKEKRVIAFIDAFQNLWSSGRQSRFLADISPKFFATAIMYSKNPIFLEAVKEPIKISELETVKNDYSDFIKDHCFAAQKSIFDNIEGKDKCLSLKAGFDKIKNWVSDYYGK